MKIAARLADVRLRRRLEKLAQEIEPAVLDAAADVLARELERAREAEDLQAPLARGSEKRRRVVGATDSESIARELGGPGRSPAPWLAPALPTALARMRRELPAHAGKLKSAARAPSRRKR